MRTRTLSVAAAGLAATLALAACTSDDPVTPGDPTTPAGDAATTSDDGLEGTAGKNGWLCDYVSPSAVEAAAGGEAVSPRQRIVTDDEDSWVCEVLSGGAGEQEPIIRLSIELGPEAREAARERAEAADGVEPGPQYLGLSFVSPGLVTGLTSCVRPGATKRSDQIAHTLVGESLKVTDAEVTDDLRSSLALMAQNLDKGLGCSPKAAIADQAAETTSP